MTRLDGGGGSANRSEWLGVELRHLLALQAVANRGSFRGAAEQLGYVQSAVSQQIAFLERLLGLRLVERSRGPKPVSLTREGEVLLVHVDEILSQLRAAQADFAALSQGRMGSLRVGAFDETAVRILPRAVRDFARRRPRVDVRTVEAGSDVELLDLCRDGELDIVFADLPLPAGPFDWKEVLTDPYVLIITASTRLARQGRVCSLEDLGGMRLVRQRGSRQGARVEAQLCARGLSPTDVQGADSTAMMQALVGANAGYAFLPRLAVDPHDHSVALVDAGRIVAPRRLGVAWHNDRPDRAAVSAFVSSATAVCATVATTNGATGDHRETGSP